MNAQLVTVDSEVFARRMNLKPFEYDRHDPVGALTRQELRTHLRGMSEREALRKFAYRAAAAETEPKISGLSPIQQKTLIEETLIARFPDEMAALNEAKSEVELAATAFEPVKLAAENELLASGATVQEPAPPNEVKPWI